MRQLIRDVLYGFTGLVYWGLPPQQQPGSYRSGDNDDDDEMSLCTTSMWSITTGRC